MPIRETQTRNHGRGYVLMTAAYNEEAHIERTITSVLSQSVLPERWVIASDGSSDGTDSIVQKYAQRHDFIRFLRVTRDPGHSFRSKVLALHQAIPLLAGAAYGFIGNLDGDVSVEPSYFEDLLASFAGDTELGIASGFVCEESDGQFRSRTSNRTESVPHAAQLVRRECYDAIGGYAALKYGGEDWYAQTSARMKGWRAESFPQLPIRHHRHTGEGSNLLRHRFRLGRLDYSFGSHPVFEIVKCLIRLPERPILIGGLARLLGFAYSYIAGEARPVPDEFVAFLRREQKDRMWSAFRHALPVQSPGSRPRSIAPNWEPTPKRNEKGAL